MISVQNKKQCSRRSQGYSLIELAVAITLIGLLLHSSTMLTSSTGVFFRRMKIASKYESQIAPLDQLQRTQIRQCRFSVYSDRATALTNLPEDRTPTGGILRCDRYDGNGWFLLVWEEATQTLWLEPGSDSSLSVTNHSYPFASLHDLTFDLSQGVLQTYVQLRVDWDYTRQSPNSTQPTTIDYVLITQNYF